VQAFIKSPITTVGQKIAIILGDVRRFKGLKAIYEKLGDVMVLGYSEMRLLANGGLRRFEAAK